MISVQQPDVACEMNKQDDAQEKNENTAHLAEAISHPLLLRAAKRVVDIIVALSFFVSFSWLFVLIGLIVFLTSGAPIIYSQPRLGKNGREFRFYKFRSMVPNSGSILAEFLESNPAAMQEWTDFQKLEADPRITRVGMFLRKTSLDELPQFWNVLRGDMSLVGPRPCMVDQKDLYGNFWSHYSSVRPGLTGLWQVSGRNKLSYKKRVALDVAYVERLSVLEDCKIFVKTIWVVLIASGSR